MASSSAHIEVQPGQSFEREMAKIVHEPVVSIQRKPEQLEVNPNKRNAFLAGAFLDSCLRMGFSYRL